MARITPFIGLAVALAMSEIPIAVAAVDETGAAQLQQVVVTAQRRSQNLKDVPLVVTVLKPENLLASNAVRLADYAQSVPGLTYFDDGSGTGLLAIRGIVTGQGTTPLVGVYVDDTPIGSTTILGSGNNLMLPDFDPSELERIEVLKGPQGTLFGSNSMGGVLRFVTASPDPTRFKGRVELDGSSVSGGGDGYGIRGSVNLPLISDRLALRVSAVHRRDPGYIDNVSPGGRSNVNSPTLDGSNVELLWKATDDLTVRLNYFYQEFRVEGNPREDFNFSTDSPVYGDLKQYRVPNNDFDIGRLQIYNATIHWNLGPATLTSSSSYGRTPYTKGLDTTSVFGGLLGEILGVPNLGDAEYLYNNTNRFTQELRLEGNTDHTHTAGSMDWIAGLYYNHENSISNDSLINTDLQGVRLNGLPLIVDEIGTTTYRETAAFGDLTYYITDRLSAQGGLRYSDLKEDALQTSPMSVLLGPASSIPVTASGKVTTYLFSPQYKLTDDATAYARVASGYRAGGPNFVIPIPGSVAPTEFKPDKLTDYELGEKSYLFAHKLYLEANLFYIDWKSIQLEATNAQAVNFVTNAASALSRGFEVSGQYRPVDQLTLSADVAYTDARLTANAPNGTYAPAGTRLPYSPRWSAAASADYSTRLTSAWTATWGGDVSFMGNRLTDIEPTADTPRPTLPSYYLVNLHITASDDHYTIGLFAKNILNERGFISASTQTLDHTGDFGVVVTQPRTLGFELSASY